MKQTPPSGEPYTVGAVLETGMDPSRVHKTLYSDNGEPVRFLVDSGSECNVIGLRDYERLSDDAAHVRLQNRVSVLRMYDGSEVATVGRARIRLRNASNGRLCMLTCRVVSKNVSPILSLSSSLDLGLLQVRDVDPLDYLPRMAASGGTPLGPTSVHSETQHGETVTDQSSIPVRSTSVPSGTPSGETVTQQPSSSLTAIDVLREYQDVFDTASIGNVLSDYVIVTDPNVRPVADPPRRVRVHVRDKLKAKLDDLTQHGLITPVTGPTPWVSNLHHFPTNFGRSACNSVKVQPISTLRPPNHAQSAAESAAKPPKLPALFPKCMHYRLNWREKGVVVVDKPSGDIRLS